MKINTLALLVLSFSLAFVTGSCSGPDRTNSEKQINSELTTENSEQSTFVTFKGNWKFNYIQNEAGESVKPISPEDIMEVKEDGSFYYILYDAEIESQGTWKLVNDGKDLEFTYDPKEGSTEKIVRTYNIAQLNQNEMVITEKGINYAFKK